MLTPAVAQASSFYGAIRVTNAGLPGSGVSLSTNSGNPVTAGGKSPFAKEVSTDGKLLNGLVLEKGVEPSCPVTGAGL